MVAVGIVAMFLTIAVPSLYRAVNEDSMRYASEKVMEVCRDARARAILDGKTMELRIRPADRTFSVAATAEAASPAGAPGGFGFDGGSLPGREDYQWGDRMRGHPGSATGPVSPPFKLGQSIAIEGLGVNGEDWTEDEEARVRFYPNGTCDAMSIVLHSLSDNERRNIYLEEVTGLAEMESDRFKFKAR